MRRPVPCLLLALAAALWAAEGKDAPEKSAPGKDEPGALSPAEKERIERLCKQLGEGQYGNQSACKQLIAIGEPAMPALLEALKDRRPQARWWAVAAVSNLATDEGYEAVLEVLRTDPHAFVRSTAVYYLRHFRTKAGKDIWPAVEEALADENPEVGRWALRLMVEDSADRVEGGYPDTDKALRRVLSDGAPALKARALTHIRSFAETNAKKARSFRPLIRQLVETADPRVRYDAVNTMVRLLEEGHVDFLREVYQKDEDPLVREGVLRCATVIPQPPVESIELFIMGLDSEDQKVREVAATLLRKGCKRYFGYDAKAPLDERRRAIENWTNWYRANRAKLQWEPDLRKFLLPGERPPQGPTPESKSKAPS